MFMIDSMYHRKLPISGVYNYVHWLCMLDSMCDRKLSTSARPLGLYKRLQANASMSSPRTAAADCTSSPVLDRIKDYSLPLCSLPWLNFILQPTLSTVSSYHTLAARKTSTQEFIEMPCWMSPYIGDRKKIQEVYLYSHVFALLTYG